VKDLRRWGAVVFIVLWTFFVLGSFFAVQKPFSAANAQAALRSLLDLAAAGWIALLALTIGTRLLRAGLKTELSPLESAILGTGLVFGALGLLGLALGLAGLLQPIVIYGLTIALSAAAAPQAIRLFRRWKGWRPANRPPRLIAIYLIVLALLALAVALLAPTDWDGLFYHLTGPKLYLEAGRITGGIDIPHLSFPALMEMLYAWAMLLRGDVAAKLLHALFGLLLAGLVALTARRFLGRRAAWPAVVVLTSMPMVGTLAGWAYNDLALAFYQLAALYAYLKSANQQIDKRRWLALSGVFAGLAMGLKYTAFVAPLVLAGFVLWRSLRNPQHTTRNTQYAPRHTLSAIVAFSLPAVLVALPWYAKNWTLTGNPLYPFLYELFDGRFWDAFRADWYSAAGTGVGLQPGTLLALPWLLTLGVRDMNYWDGRTGPLFLLALPLLLFYGLFRFRRRDANRPAALDPLLIFALAQFAFWTVGVIWSRSLWQSRLLLPCFAALAPATGWLWTELPRFDRPRFSVSGFARLAVGLTLLLTLIDATLLTLQIDPLPYLIGAETREAYLTRRLGAHYAAMGRINTELPADATVVFLWEPRSYYCQRDCRPDSILDAFPHLVHQYRSAGEIARAWQREGVTHVLVHRAGLQFVLNETPDKIDVDLLAELESRHLEKLFDVGGAYDLYALREEVR
jgi:4-amino-4-deoxy-L-arabinose transferase-like glycosyltransferase